ncbi:Cerato-platanin [Fistulina hepatica ATCC 64428]|uniref:Cerato-platanin n=1 Tax=Fistulina hepatica ATCC 64428 TaxID=1128425 RepID=A0A0D7AK02_9AGAR|nr:Cerato-platanin [Fistulina hepatica ATCC 64428]
MKFFASLLALFAVATSVVAGGATVPVTYDETYDNWSQSLDTVACSNGQNGLLTKGYTTFGSLPDFPYIGGAQAVTGWNSPNCGTCWKLYYPVTGVSINVLAIDFAGSGFNIALEAMNVLTDGDAVDVGRVEVEAFQVDASVCGL